MNINNAIKTWTFRKKLKEPITLSVGSYPKRKPIISKTAISHRMVNIIKKMAFLDTFFYSGSCALSMCVAAYEYISIFFIEFIQNLFQ